MLKTRLLAAMALVEWLQPLGALANPDADRCERHDHDPHLQARADACDQLGRIAGQDRGSIVRARHLRELEVYASTEDRPRGHNPM